MIRINKSYNVEFKYMYSHTNVARNGKGKIIHKYKVYHVVYDVIKKYTINIFDIKLSFKFLIKRFNAEYKNNAEELYNLLIEDLTNVELPDKFNNL